MDNQTATSGDAERAPFSQRTDAYRSRADKYLKRCLDTTAKGDEGHLCRALRYAVFNGGKRLRPMLVYAAGEVLQVDARLLDAPAGAVELIHCYSLVHDDLPAMDDDHLRRGQPTLHLAFDEATAILAGDALQALAFEVLGSDPELSESPRAALDMVQALASACGADGMAGGQALDLAWEGQRPDRDQLEQMYARKTGALIRAAVMMPCALAGSISESTRSALSAFADSIGLAFQIRDDVLDIQGETEQIGKPAGADQAMNKATWPALFGLAAAQKRIDELAAEARVSLDRIDADTTPLAWLGSRLVDREF